MCLIAGPNEILGRALVGNSKKVKLEERHFFEEIMRTKTATAQWISLSDPTSK